MQSKRTHKVGLICAWFLAAYAVIYAAILLFLIASFFNVQFSNEKPLSTVDFPIWPLLLLALAITPFYQIRFLQGSAPKHRIATLFNIAVAAAPMLSFFYFAFNLAPNSSVAHRAGTINFWLVVTVWAPAILAALSFRAVLSLGIQDLKTLRGEQVNAS